VDKLKDLIVVGLIMSMFGSCEVSAEDGVDLEVTADFFGKYIWRG